LRGEASLYEVSKDTGVPRGDISAYEKGEHLPSAKTLLKLSDYYEVPYTELRKLYYDAYFSDPHERAIVLAWAKEAQ
jgi:transcriptional regulator with XRE-family HTH domain